MRTPRPLLDGIPKYKIFPENPISCGAEASRFEIGSDNPCSRQLSGIAQSIQPFIPDERNLTQILDPNTRAHSHSTSRSPCRTLGVL
jgi:hypothetical protein